MEDVFPIKNEDIPARYVSLPEGISCCFFLNHCQHVTEILAAVFKVED